MSSDIPELYSEQWQVKVCGILTPCGDFDLCMQKLKKNKQKLYSGYQNSLIPDILHSWQSYS